ncbi:hypothetical protein BZG36_00711 [Bifiguratus adelaidae]|uniref:TBP-associated factor 6 n=1 Tax=Bifiguratus adelaidae TaxID=1938954 RepID=A0A261Y6U6_9FUNG|nr:hypothetical protein BZG36_00711 [Bifiguratus adelaidae]
MSIFPKDTVKNIAESLSITNLKDGVAVGLANDVEYRIHEIVQEAMKFMRHSRRSRLTVEDINRALQVRNVEPLYGFKSAEPYRFRRTVSNTQDLCYVEDEEIDFDTILNRPLPKVPLDVTFTAHWLAIEGVQPAIPQNPTPSDAKSDLLTKRIKTQTVNGPNADNVDLKPLVKHVLSKELQMYYERITDAVLSGEERLRSQAFESLRQDPGLHQLLPYFVQFISQKITQNLKDLFTLESVLSMVQSLLNNPHLFVEPYLHQIMPAILSCLVARRLCETPNEDHWRIRQFAAKIVSMICERYGKAYHTLQPRITKTLLRAFLDPLKPLTTHYGSIIGLASLGHEVIKILLVPNIKVYSLLLEKELEQMANPTKAMEAAKCKDALVSAVKTLLDAERRENQGNMDEDVTEDTAQKLRENMGALIADPIIAANHSNGLIKSLADAAQGE